MLLNQIIQSIIGGLLMFLFWYLKKRDSKIDSLEKQLSKNNEEIKERITTIIEKTVDKIDIKIEKVYNDLSSELNGNDDVDKRLIRVEEDIKNKWKILDSVENQCSLLRNRLQSIEASIAILNENNSNLSNNIEKIGKQVEDFFISEKCFREKRRERDDDIFDLLRKLVDKN